MGTDIFVIALLAIAAIGAVILVIKSNYNNKQ